jgi:hypothetical protein
MQGNACFAAGPVQSTGLFLYPPKVLTLGATSSQTSGAFQMRIEELDLEGNEAIFDASGAFQNNNMVGTYSCDPDYTLACGGMGGNLTGAQ